MNKHDKDMLIASDPDAFEADTFTYGGPSGLSAPS